MTPKGGPGLVLGRRQRIRQGSMRPSMPRASTPAAWVVSSACNAARAGVPSWARKTPTITGVLGHAIIERPAGDVERLRRRLRSLRTRRSWPVQAYVSDDADGAPTGRHRRPARPAYREGWPMRRTRSFSTAGLMLVAVLAGGCAGHQGSSSELGSAAEETGSGSDGTLSTTDQPATGETSRARSVEVMTGTIRVDATIPGQRDRFWGRPKRCQRRRIHRRLQQHGQRDEYRGHLCRGLDL